MVAHHRIGADVYSEAVSKREQALFYPVSPMFERSTTVEVLATEKGAAYTAGNAVVVGSVIQTDKGFSRPGH
jgi:hypothetical protein